MNPLVLFLVAVLLFVAREVARQRRLFYREYRGRKLLHREPPRTRADYGELAAELLDLPVELVDVASGPGTITITVPSRRPRRWYQRRGKLVSSAELDRCRSFLVECMPASVYLEHDVKFA